MSQAVDDRSSKERRTVVVTAFYMPASAASTSHKLDDPVAQADDAGEMLSMSLACAAYCTLQKCLICRGDHFRSTQSMCLELDSDYRSKMPTIATLGTLNITTFENKDTVKPACRHGGPPTNTMD